MRLAHLTAVAVSIAALAGSVRAVADQPDARAWVRLAQAQQGLTPEEEAKRKRREQGQPGGPGGPKQGQGQGQPGGPPAKSEPPAPKQGMQKGPPSKQMETPHFGSQTPPKGGPQQPGGPPKQVERPAFGGQPKADGQPQQGISKQPPPRQVQTPDEQSGGAGQPKGGMPPSKQVQPKDLQHKQGETSPPAGQPQPKAGNISPQQNREQQRAPQHQFARPLPGGPAAPAVGLAPHRDDQSQPRFQHLDDLKKERREHVEQGGRRVIEEPDKRVIVKQEGGGAFIRHDETERFRRVDRDARTERRSDGSTVTIIVRPEGQIYTVVDSEGHLLRRYRRTREGREIGIIDNTRFFRPGRPRGILDLAIALAPPVIRIPREKYIVEYRDASEEDVYEALSAPPVEAPDRAYSLEEIRRSDLLRDRMRRVDLDVINFESGSWDVTPVQYPRLEWVAKAMNRIIRRNPEEVFMIEGYTDAVGSDVDNLTLSDRRAESVAVVLTESFGVPPENLVTQGYGEQFLKVPTQGAERANRRVAARRVTPLMSQAFAR